MDIFTYVLFGTLLFFFWVYGIVSFVVDLKRQIIPWIRARRATEDEESDSEANTEQLSELYGHPDDE